MGDGLNRPSGIASGEQADAIMFDQFLARLRIGRSGCRRRAWCSQGSLDICLGDCPITATALNCRQVQAMRLSPISWPQG